MTKNRNLTSRSKAADQAQRGQQQGQDPAPPATKTDSAGYSYARAGLDEQLIAERMAALITDLDTSGREGKLLLQALTESTRVLKLEPVADTTAGVRLSHNVPRPARPAQPERDEIIPT